MIAQETIRRDDGATLYRTYSDAGYRIRQTETGAIYDEAVDIAADRYSYTETDEPIEDDTDAAEILSILLGGAV